MLSGPVVPREVIVAERRHKTGFSELLDDRWGMETYFLSSGLALHTHVRDHEADLDQRF